LFEGTKDMNSILKKFKTIFTQPLLTQDQRNFWEENGYLILQGFFDKGTMEKLYAEIDKIWNERKREDNPLVIDVQEGPYSGRKKFKDVPDEVRNLAHKLNDLFLVSEEVRSINLDSKLCGILAELLDGDPMVCNSLNFEREVSSATILIPITCLPWFEINWWLPRFVLKMFIPMPGLYAITQGVISPPLIFLPMEVFTKYQRKCRPQQPISSLKLKGLT
jgi:hypothetical protein